MVDAVGLVAGADACRGRRRARAGSISGTSPGSCRRDVGRARGLRGPGTLRRDSGGTGPGFERSTTSPIEEFACAAVVAAGLEAAGAVLDLHVVLEDRGVGDDALASSRCGDRRRSCCRSGRSRSTASPGPPGIDLAHHPDRAGRRPERSRPGPAARARTAGRTAARAPGHARRTRRRHRRSRRRRRYVPPSAVGRGAARLVGRPWRRGARRRRTGRRTAGVDHRLVAGRRGGPCRSDGGRHGASLVVVECAGAPSAVGPVGPAVEPGLQHARRRRPCRPPCAGPALAAPLAREERSAVTVVRRSS